MGRSPVATTALRPASLRSQRPNASAARSCTVPDRSSAAGRAAGPGRRCRPGRRPRSAGPAPAGPGSDRTSRRAPRPGCSVRRPARWRRRRSRRRCPRRAGGRAGRRRPADRQRAPGGVQAPLDRDRSRRVGVGGVAAVEQHRGEPPDLGGARVGTHHRNALLLELPEHLRPGAGRSLRTGRYREHQGRVRDGQRLRDGAPRGGRRVDLAAGGRQPHVGPRADRAQRVAGVRPSVRRRDLVGDRGGLGGEDVGLRGGAAVVAVRGPALVAAGELPRGRDRLRLGEHPQLDGGRAAEDTVGQPASAVDQAGAR